MGQHRKGILRLYKLIELGIQLAIRIQRKRGTSMQTHRQTSVLSILFTLVALSLTAAPPSEYRLHEAIKDSDLDRLTGLLQAGHNPNQSDETGRTALHYAVAKFQDRGYLYVSELLRFGADTNMRDSNGATAVRYAAESGSAAIVTLLLENGADPNLRTVGGGSPLGAAYIHGHMGVASLLEEYGAILPSEVKRLQLKAVGHVKATLRSSSKEVAGESLQRRQARIARSLHDMREKYGLHDQLSDDHIRRIAQEETSPEAEELK